MPAENHSWTIASAGVSNGPSGSDNCCPDGKIDIPFGPATEGDGYVSNLAERFDVPYEWDFNSKMDVNPAPDRVDVGDSIPKNFGAPAPFHGGVGQPIDFDAVAPDRHFQPGPDLDGSSGGEDHMPGSLD